MSKGRCYAAQLLVEELQRNDHIRALIIGNKQLLLANIQLADTKTETFQENNHLKNITFKELQGRNFQQFHECLKHHVGEMPAVLTVAHTLRYVLC
jgi:hypothetical protein